ncbi:hypothetical protein GCM10027059_50450 [Myceligenerans halotolerans]
MSIESHERYDTAIERDDAGVRVEQGAAQAPPSASTDEPATAARATGTDTPAPTRARNRRGKDRALIRRVAAKAKELGEAPAEHRARLAELLGVEADLADLTVAVMTDDGSALRGVHDVVAVRDAAALDPLGGALAVAELGRRRIRGMWSLLVRHGADLPRTAPPSDAKAAIVLARGIDSIQDAVIQELTAVAALGRKP